MSTEFIYRQEYIENNLLNKELIKKNNIRLFRRDEVFVQHPRWSDYYFSQYGRAISKKDNRLKLLNLNKTYNGYYNVSFSEPNDSRTSITIQAAVADIFCPNLWQNIPRENLQAHHIDGDRENNHYKNLMLLPKNLHTQFDRVKEIIYLHDSTFEKLTPYEIMEQTGISLNEIADTIEGLHTKKIHAEKSSGHYSIVNIMGFDIGFKFRKHKNKKKEKQA